ncbi:MAG: T9SS type A sorting domain-containing protein [Bacteroidia bacterium]
MNKYIILLTIILITYSLKSIGQELRFREHFDFIHNNTINYTENLPVDNNGSHNNLERVAYILESYLISYEATLDKSYLIKFINKTIEIISLRGTYLYSETNNGNYIADNTWNFVTYNNNDTRHQMYIGGVILWPLTHFCHIVFIDYLFLCEEFLPLSLINNIPNSSITSYGLFADWLVRRCVETIDYYLNNYWISDEEGFHDEWTKEFGAAINQQTGFATSLFYLGKLHNIIPCVATMQNQFTYSGLQSYFYKAEIMARLYKKEIKIYKDNGCPISNSTNCFSMNTFNLINSNNTYWWYITGWGFDKQFRNSCNDTRVNCTYYFDDSGSSQRYIEDISHGFLTLVYPIVLNKYMFNSFSSIYFNDIDMYRFRNTFIRNIWDGNSQNPGFYNSVSGDGYDNRISDNSCGPKRNLDPCPFNYHKWSSLNWALLNKWDSFDSNGNIFEILKTFYINNAFNSPLNLINGSRYLGLSNLLKLQWEKECFNTTYYNRKLIYNQDFWAKNELTISPEQFDTYHSLNSSSFAEPIITENKFTIEPGVTCNMKAGERIVLKPGFHAKAGSNFRAYIEPNLCTDGQIVPPGGGGNNEPNYESWVAQANTKSIKQQEEHSAQTTTNTSLNEQKNNLPKQEFNIHPNPNTGVFTIYVQTLNEQEQLQLSVMDVYGKQLLAQQINNSVNHQIDLSAYSKGVYYVSVTGANGFREVKKVLVN